jgi:ribose/xylose/arabinose/galactoside ABC-type transport system permease subunit
MIYSARKLLLSDHLVLLLCGGLSVVSAWNVPGFFSTGNFQNVISVACPLLIVALGQMLVMVSGGIDLSITATMAITSVAGATIMSNDQGWLTGSVWAVPIGCGAMLMAGGLVGLGNGLCVAIGKMPPFIVTLTSMMFMYGLATWWTQSKNIGSLPSSFLRLGANGAWGLIIASTLAGLIAICLAFTKYGRWLYAIGQRESTSVVSGLPVVRVKCAVYVIAGVFAAIASMIYTAQLETGSPVLGKNLLLDIIGAVVIGGTSLFGGKGRVSGVLAGVLFFALLDNVLNLLSLSYFAIGIAKGVLIVSAAYLDSMRHRWSESV